MFTKAYTPEQSAFGKLDNNRDVLILYIKEFDAEVRSVNAQGLSTFSYDWFETENQDSYVLRITWETGLHIAIRFDRQHFKLLAQLVEPKDVILTTSPLSEMMQRAQEGGVDFLEFTNVLTFSNLTFTAPAPGRLKN